MNQLSFFKSSINHQKPTGEVLRDRGMKRALAHAEQVHKKWQEQALEFLHAYAKEHDRFSGEMVRLESKEKVARPPSLRSWGSVLLAAAKRGWIKQIGYVQVQNERAHRANAALWQSCLKR